MDVAGGVVHEKMQRKRDNKTVCRLRDSRSPQHRLGQFGDIANLPFCQRKRMAKHVAQTPLPRLHVLLRVSQKVAAARGVFACDVGHEGVAVVVRQLVEVVDVVFVGHEASSAVGLLLEEECA